MPAPPRIPITNVCDISLALSATDNNIIINEQHHGTLWTRMAAVQRLAVAGSDHDIHQRADDNSRPTYPHPGHALPQRPQLTVSTNALSNPAPLCTIAIPIVFYDIWDKTTRFSAARKKTLIKAFRGHASPLPLWKWNKNVNEKKDHHACPRVTAASCTQKNTKTHVTLTFDRWPWNSIGF